MLGSMLGILRRGTPIRNRYRPGGLLTIALCLPEAYTEGDYQGIQVRTAEDPDGIDVDGVDIDFGDVTGRVHAAWWIQSLKTKEMSAWENVLVGMAKIGYEMKPEDIEAFEALVNRLAGM